MKEDHGTPGALNNKYKITSSRGKTTSKDLVSIVILDRFTEEWKTLRKSHML